MLQTNRINRTLSLILIVTFLTNVFLLTMINGSFAAKAGTNCAFCSGGIDCLYGACCCVGNCFCLADCYNCGCFDSEWGAFSEICSGH